MKKIGYFFSGFLPILTTTAAQILASFFMFGIAALFLCPASQSTGFDADTIETLLTIIMRMLDQINTMLPNTIKWLIKFLKR